MPRTSRARNTDAKANPVIVSKTIDATQVDGPKDTPRVLTVDDGPKLTAADNSMPQDRPEMGTIQTRHDPEKLANLLFMDELVTVDIHQAALPTDAKIFEIGVNGKMQLFERGKRYTVKRMYANELAQRKVTRYTQERRNNPITGQMEDIQVPHTTLVYPFSMVEDANPKGRLWLNWVLAQP